MCAGLVFSLVFLSQGCSVFLSCDISTVTVVIRGSRELHCCFVVWQFVFAQAKEHVSDHLHALHYHLILTRLQHCDTKRSVAVQTADSVEHADCLWDWLTTSTTTARCSSGAPSNIHIARNSRDFSAACSGLWTRFATRASSCHRAPRQLSVSSYGIESRLSLST